jgi:putative tricarboxylic transport membrane protein
MSKNAFLSLYLCFLGLGGSYLLGGLKLQRGTLEVPGSGLFPQIVGIFIVILASILLVQTVIARGRCDPSEALPKGSDLRRVVWVTVALFIYAFSLELLGYLACTTGLMVAIVRSLGVKNWGKIVAIAILTGALSYCLFAFILDVPLPRGEVFP